MCFYIRNTIESRTLWVAKEDIVCYKILKYNRASSVQDFQYKLNKVYKEPLFVIPKPSFGIYKIRMTEKGFMGDFYTPLYHGFHSYIELDQDLKNDAKRWWECVYKCIIPKGSEFYYDPVEKQYLSNQIKIVKKLT